MWTVIEITLTVRVPHPTMRYIVLDRSRHAPDTQRTRYLSFPPSNSVFERNLDNTFSFAEAEIMCDQFNIRDYGEVDDGSRP